MRNVCAIVPMLCDKRVILHEEQNRHCELIKNTYEGALLSGCLPACRQPLNLC